MEAFRHLDTTTMPWAPEPTIKGMKSKVLFRDPESGAVTIIRSVPPGYGVGDQPFRHYHTSVVERSFYLAGDFPHWEFDGPEDKTGDLIMFRRGLFMDRPPNTIHGLFPHPKSEIGGMAISWNTGGGVGVDDPNYEVESIDVPFENPGRFNVAFTSPRIFMHDTLPWNPHPRVKGWKIKPLAPRRGVAPEVALVHVTADWQPARSGAVVEPTDERRWMFVVSGGLDVVVSQGARQDAIALKEHGYLEWRAPAVIGFAAGAVSDIGATVLCVGHVLG
ncbi:MAG: hypothetical protein FJX65_03850 [Alphaproteobacteria bacterium]|nr:hypothetical protein [Alphaproteobacteria bacterium]